MTRTLKTTFATFLLTMALAAGCAARPVTGTAPGAAAGPAPAATATTTATTPAKDARAAQRAQARAQLADARQLQLDRLRAYRQKGEFPRQRLVRNQKINLFIDDDGRYCAMAHLLSLAGEDALVQQVALTNNTLRLRDVHEGPLLGWMLASGLTQEEIDFVQEPYMFDEQSDTDRARERQRLIDHFVKVEERLLRDWDKSLDAAVDRWMAAQGTQGA